MAERLEPEISVRSWIQQLEARANGSSALQLRAAVAAVAERGAEAIGEAPVAVFATRALRVAGALPPEAPPVTRLADGFAVLDALAEAERGRVCGDALAELFAALTDAGVDALFEALEGESTASRAAGASAGGATAADARGYEALLQLAPLLAAADAAASGWSAALACAARLLGGAAALVDWSGRRPALTVARGAGDAGDVHALSAAAFAWAERLGGPSCVPPVDAESEAPPRVHARGSERRSGVRAVPLAVDGEGPVGILLLAPPRSAGEGEPRPGPDARLLRAVTSQFALALESRRRLEAAREAGARADERARSERETLSVISHDLRNPLSAILMSVALLQRAHRAEAGPTLRQIEVIKRSADRINYLLQNVSDSVSVEIGQLAVDPRPEPLPPMVDDCLRMLAAHAQHKSVRLDCEIAPDAPAVLAERERFVQTLANVLAARVRMAPRGSSVTVRARREGAHVRFSVAGRGAGAGDDDVARWFDRAYWSRPNASPSTGLALSVAKSLVEAHGGRMWAEAGDAGSEDGPSVEFTLPAATEEQVAAARAAASSELGS